MAFKITKEIFLQIFPKAKSKQIDEFVQTFNKYNEVFNIDTKLRAAHFFAQLREEVGAKARIRDENFNYSVKGLKRTFKRFRNNPKWAAKYGRSRSHPANSFMIASIAYADRIGNGDIASADGWKYKGRGFIQLTGKHNYNRIAKVLAKVLKGEINLMQYPDRAGTPVGAMLTAMAYWQDRRLHKYADGGSSAWDVNNITRIINKHTKSYANRQTHFRIIHRYFKKLPDVQYA